MPRPGATVKRDVVSPAVKIPSNQRPPSAATDNRNIQCVTPFIGKRDCESRFLKNFRFSKENIAGKVFARLF